MTEVKLDLQSKAVEELCSSAPEGTSDPQHAANMLGAAVVIFKAAKATDLEIIASLVNTLGFYEQVTQAQVELEAMKAKMRAEAREEALRQAEEEAKE